MVLFPTVKLWQSLRLCVAAVVLFASLPTAAQNAISIVAPYDHFAGPTMLKLDMAFSAGRQPNGQELIPIKPDANAHMGGFIYRYPPLAGLIANQWPGASYCNNLTWEFRDQTRVISDNYNPPVTTIRIRQ